MAARASLVFCFALVACFPPGEGEPAPADGVYFPVGLAIDAKAKHLFIANSDFDLQFNSGTVLSWNLQALRESLPRTCASSADCEWPSVSEGELPKPAEECDLELVGAVRPNGEPYAPGGWCVEVSRQDEVATVANPCGQASERGAEQQLLYPGRCNTVPVPSVRGAGNFSVRIGAFATDALYRQSPFAEQGGVQGRLFVPVRGDATLHWIDVGSDGSLDCGQANSEDGESCDAGHRSGDDPIAENTRLARLQGEPFGIDADADGRVLLVSNQTSGAVGLFTNDWAGATRYQYTQFGLPERPIGVAAVPEPKATAALRLPSLPGFLVTYRNASSIHLIRAFLDEGADPARPYTKVIGQSTVALNSSGTDQRGLAIDANARREAEAACATRFGLDAACVADPECASGDAGYVDCVTTAASIPLDVFVASRSPASLLRGTSRPVIDDLPTSDVPVFQQTLPIGLGPSRVVLGQIINPKGELERRIFVLSFDSRRILIYDPVRDRIEGDIVTGRGPQAFVVAVSDSDPEDGVHDPSTQRALGFVAQFTDSYIGVISLDQRHPATYGTLIATVGNPVPPRASK
jgi:hypothetical protein